MTSKTTRCKRFLMALTALALLGPPAPVSAQVQVEADSTYASRVLLVSRAYTTLRKVPFELDVPSTVIITSNNEIEVVLLFLPRTNEM